MLHIALLAVLLSAVAIPSSAPATTNGPAAIATLPPGAPDPNAVGSTHIHRPAVDIKCDVDYDDHQDWKSAAADCGNAAATYMRMHQRFINDPDSPDLGAQPSDDIPDLWLLGYAARCDEQAAAAYFNGGHDVFGAASKDASRTYARSAHAEALGVLFALRTRFEGATRDELEQQFRDVLMNAMVAVKARTEEHFPELAERT